MWRRRGASRGYLSFLALFLLACASCAAASWPTIQTLSRGQRLPFDRE